MRKLIASSAAGLALVATLAGCNSNKPSVSPSASAAAASEKAQAQAYVSHCIPSNSLGQVQLIQQLASDPAQRTKLAACLGIPQDQRQAFEAAAVGDAEHVHWSDKSARAAFFEATLPELAVQYRNKP